MEIPLLYIRLLTVDGANHNIVFDGVILNKQPADKRFLCCYINYYPVDRVCDFPVGGFVHKFFT